MKVDIFNTDKKYMTIVADPPWNQSITPFGYKKHKAKPKIEYPTMTLNEIAALDVCRISGIGCHLWLWTTNEFLRYGFDIMESWGFKYLAPITWVKPSGIGNYFVHRTQVVLMGYKDRCIFNNARYLPTVLFAELPKKHSEKPPALQDYIESISEEPRIELFSRRQRFGWDCWGNEV